MSGAVTTPLPGMNRGQLKQAIMSWLHRASLSTPVASNFDIASGFIAMAEQDLNEKLRARCMLVRTSQAIDGQYTTLPCDHLEPFDFRPANGAGPALLYINRDMAAGALWQKTMGTPPGYSLAGYGPDFMPIVQPPGFAWGDGTPQRFTIIGSEIEWSPFPQPSPDEIATFTWPVVEMTYYQRIGLGMNDTDTNAVLSTYPAAYLYGSLVHSAPFLRDDSRVQTWATLYNNAVDGANREHERSRTQGSRLRQTFRRLA